MKKMQVHVFFALLQSNIMEGRENKSLLSTFIVHYIHLEQR
jgi:hypothetical protein